MHILLTDPPEIISFLEWRALQAPTSSPFDGMPNQLAQILKELKQMSDTFDTEMTTLKADVAAQSTVIASASKAFQGLAAQLAAVEAAQTAAGATPAQVAELTTFRISLEANSAALEAAIPANTPAAAATPAPTVDTTTNTTDATPTA